MFQFPWLRGILRPEQKTEVTKKPHQFHIVGLFEAKKSSPEGNEKTSPNVTLKVVKPVIMYINIINIIQTRSVSS